MAGLLCVDSAGEKLHYTAVPVGAFAQKYFHFQSLMTNKKAFLIENNSSTSSHNKNHDKSIFTKRKTFHALGAFCDIFSPSLLPFFSLSVSFLCVRKSSLPCGLSVIMLMGNKEIILNGTLISSLLPLPSA